MARNVLILNNPTFKLAATQAGLAAGTAYECQITKAIISATPNFTTIPATACAGQSQSPGKSSYSTHIEWLQDWTASLGGLSGYAYTNDTKLMWFEFVVDTNVATVKATGQIFVVAGDYGGEFGSGVPASAAADWPNLDKPVITLPATLLAAEADTEAA
jgi:hypothetical protein